MSHDHPTTEERIADALERIAGALERRTSRVLCFGQDDGQGCHEVLELELGAGALVYHATADGPIQAHYCARHAQTAVQALCDDPQLLIRLARARVPSRVPGKR